jgi:hypothetical protein
LPVLVRYSISPKPPIAGIVGRHPVLMKISGPAWPVPMTIASNRSSLNDALSTDRSS